ncbi:ABC transporter [Bacillus sp. TS-2]|nr:ABC transporter [Bacillus sp. TS-2]
MRPFRQTKSNQTKKHGQYSILSTLLVVGIFIFIQLIVSERPITIDLTENRVFSLSEASTSFLEQLDSDVTLLSLNRIGEEDTNLTRLLREYEKVTERITIENMDPERVPHIISHYQDGNSAITLGSVIVEVDDSYQVLDAVDMFIYDDNYEKIESFQVESLVTNTIAHLIENNHTTIYELRGHGESELPDILKETLSQKNFAWEELQLLRDDWKPQQGDIVWIQSLQKDLTNLEEETLSQFLEEGGRILLLHDIQDQEFPNVQTLLERYGMSIRKEMVFENSSTHTITSENYYLLPNFIQHPIANSLINGESTAITVYAQPIDVLNMRKDTLVLEPLLMSSSESFGKSFEVMKQSTTYEKVENDSEGPFQIGMAVTEERIVDHGFLNGKMVVYSSSYLANEDFIEASNQANLELLVNSVFWLSERENPINIMSKDVSSEILTMNKGQQMMIAMIVIVFIPLLIMSVGGFVWYKRNKND